MTGECPNCGAQYSDTVTVSMGDRYDDLFGRPPRDLFARYVRLCPDPDQASRASRDPSVDLEVYLHRGADLAGGRGA